jgi:hypothetical protein
LIEGEGAKAGDLVKRIKANTIRGSIKAMLSRKSVIRAGLVDRLQE